MSRKSNVVFDICEEVTLLSLLFVVAVLYFPGTNRKEKKVEKER